MKTFHNAGLYVGLLSTTLGLVLPGATPANAQSVSLVHTFSGTDGANPRGRLLLAADGNVYGTTFYGGGGSNGGDGVIFRLSPQGIVTKLYDFSNNPSAGVRPYAGLIQGPDGTFYGTTDGGGANGYGTVYKMTIAGNPATCSITVLHDFNGSDGSYPYGSLLLAADGNLYGTTILGDYNAGTLFKVSTTGTFTLLQNFGGMLGVEPTSTLIQGPDGGIYGTTQGGYNGNCSVFKITPSGGIVWVNRQISDGPDEGLIFGADGNLYGTTDPNSAIGAGTIFEMTTNGALTSTTIVANGVDASGPFSQLVLGPDANMYGITWGGGLFKFDGSNINYLYGNPGHAIGYTFGTALTLGSDGDFYGVGMDTTTSGGTYDSGTIYKLNVGFPTISGFSPAAAGPGSTVHITGTNFSGVPNTPGVTAITINGAPATFTVVDSSDINAVVPTGAAATGKIAVSAPTSVSSIPMTVSLGTFTASTPPPPVQTPAITSFSPTLSGFGTPVAITGTSFTGATFVKFHGVVAPFTVVSDTQINTTVPTNATTGPITVTNSKGTGTNATNFTVATSISTVSPPSGAVGTAVTITGASFTGASLVKFNGTSAPFTVVSDTKITTTVPSGANTGTISVTTPNGIGTSAGNFAVYPTVSSFTPSTASAGATVTIGGANFTGATSVKFHGFAASFATVSDNSITATVPTGATTGPISVTTPSGTGTSSTNFVVPTP